MFGWYRARDSLAIATQQCPGRPRFREKARRDVTVMTGARAVAMRKTRDRAGVTRAHEQKRGILRCVMRLTEVAVVALPAGETDALPGRTAAVVAEAVVSRPTQVLAALAVVVRHAPHPVLVLHPRVGTTVLVHGPLLPDVQPFLGGQPADQHFL